MLVSSDIWAILSNGAVQGVSLHELADKYATPLYVYDGNAIERALRAYQQHTMKPKVYFAVKANSNLTLLARMANWGAGFDTVSQGEIMRVLEAGGSADRIVFSGVAKTNEELYFALKVGIGCFNVESDDELTRLADIASKVGKKARIALRVNPNVDAKTHPYISTGIRDNKFGVPMENALAFYQRAQQLESIEIIGVACHIGSQITSLSPFKAAIQSIKYLADKLCEQGICIQHLDIGGGLGVPMQENEVVPSAQALVEMLYQEIGDAGYQLHLEPGRSLVANNGLLLSRVVGTKQQTEKKFVMIDAAMNDYMRPALYQALPVMKNISQSEKTEWVDVVGPVCETGDTFARKVNLYAESNDLIVFAGVGAYGMSMSSQYNTRLRAAEVLIENGEVKLVRQREIYTQLWQNELNLNDNK